MLTEQSSAILGVCIALPALDILAVALRLWARRIKGQALGKDDFLSILALMCLVGTCVVYVWGSIKGGIGHHINDISLSRITLFLKVIFALQFPYLFTVTLIKLSILTFYQKIFALPKFIKVARGACVFVILWFITFFCATLFQAWPISGNWTLDDQKSHTMNQYAMYASAAVLEIVEDVVTLIMPLFVIWNLRVQSSEKWIISAIFLLGGFVCFASVVRLYYLVRHLGPKARADQDLTYNLASIVIWSAIEPCVGLICACLPTLRPVFRYRTLPFLRSLKTKVSSRSTQRTEIPKPEVPLHSIKVVNQLKSLPHNDSLLRSADEMEFVTYTQIGGKNQHPQAHEV